jgi:hypothetical protein
MANAGAGAIQIKAARRAGESSTPLVPSNNAFFNTAFAENRGAPRMAGTDLRRHLIRRLVPS